MTRGWANCPDCWGTGHWRGYGAPCSREAPTAPVPQSLDLSWIDVDGLCARYGVQHGLVLSDPDVDYGRLLECLGSALERGSPVIVAYPPGTYAVGVNNVRPRTFFLHPTSAPSGRPRYLVQVGTSLSVRDEGDWVEMDPSTGRQVVLSVRMLSPSKQAGAPTQPPPQQFTAPLSASDAAPIGNGTAYYVANHDSGLSFGLTDAVTMEEHSQRTAWALAFDLPDLLPPGVPMLRMLSCANAATGEVRVTPSWRVFVPEAREELQDDDYEEAEDTEFRSEGEHVIRWETGDANAIKETLIPLDASTLAPGGRLLMDLDFTNDLLLVDSVHGACVVFDQSTYVVHVDYGEEEIRALWGVPPDPPRFDPSFEAFRRVIREAFLGGRS